MKGYYPKIQRIKVHKEPTNIFTELGLIAILVGIIVIGIKWLEIFGIK